MSKIKSAESAVKFALVTVVAVAGFFLYAKMSSGANRDFALADDFPRGALCYAEFKDLPALLKMWNGSELKKRYLETANFKEFQNRHLALKLVSRWQEFNDVLGFEINAETLVGATENQSAVAVYDIGKMEMVFVAPVSDERFAATMFFQNQAEFEAVTLADKTVYYSRDDEADRGRQRQKILFANSKGRFVLATSENLLLRTLANINHKTRNDSLSDAPDFANLTKRVTPHLAAVWVDQTKLNEDWYFKRYWLMRNVADLKKFRAGIFDFEMLDDKLIERREFLLTESKASGEQKISAAEIRHLESFVPADAPFFRLQSVAGKLQQAANLLCDAIFDCLPAPKVTKTEGRWRGYDNYDDSDGYSDDDNYYYLDSTFDQFIDEDDKDAVKNDDQSSERTANLESNLRQILANAQTSAAITIANPRKLEAPLFIQFEKAAVFYLAAPQNLNQQNLENAISAISARGLTVADEKSNLVWNNQTDSKNSWRELTFPALKRQICYSVQGNTLIVANSAEYLKFLLSKEKDSSALDKTDSLSELSVILLDNRESAFDVPMNAIFKEERKLQPQSGNAADADFFIGNIGGLLSAANQAKRIEIKRNAGSRFLSEEVLVFFK